MDKPAVCRCIVENFTDAPNTPIQSLLEIEMCFFSPHMTLNLQVRHKLFRPSDEERQNLRLARR